MESSRVARNTCYRLGIGIAVGLLLFSTPAEAKKLRDKDMPEWAMNVPYGCAVGTAAFVGQLDMTRDMARAAAMRKLYSSVGATSTNFSVSTTVSESSVKGETVRTETTKTEGTRQLVTAQFQSDYVREHWVMLVCIDPHRTLAKDMPAESTTADWAAFIQKVDTDFTDLLAQHGEHFRAFKAPAPKAAKPKAQPAAPAEPEGPADGEEAPADELVEPESEAGEGEPESAE